MFDELVKFFVVLLVVVEPLSVLPVLAGLTEGADEAWRRRMSFKAIGLSAIVCLVFAAAGTALLDIRGALNPTADPLALDIQAKATDLELAPRRN